MNDANNGANAYQHGARLSGALLRLVSTLLRAPVIGPPLRRMIVSRTVEPHLAGMDLLAPDAPPPMAAPPAFRRSESP